MTLYHAVNSNAEVLLSVESTSARVAKRLLYIELVKHPIVLEQWVDYGFEVKLEASSWTPVYEITDDHHRHIKEFTRTTIAKNTEGKDWLLTIRTSEHEFQTRIYKNEDGLYCNDHNSKKCRTQTQVREYFRNNYKDFMKD